MSELGEHTLGPPSAYHNEYELDFGTLYGFNPRYLLAKSFNKIEIEAHGDHFEEEAQTPKDLWNNV
jgi:hypothetical protein